MTIQAPTSRSPAGPLLGLHSKANPPNTMHPIKTSATLAVLFVGGLLTVFAVSLSDGSQRAYASCLVEHQSPSYCRLLISGR